MNTVSHRRPGPRICTIVRVACALGVLAIVPIPTSGTTAPQTASPGPSDPPPPALRLDGAVRPVTYDLTLVVDPERANYSGIVKIGLELMRPTSFFWLHAQDLTIHDATVDGIPARSVATDQGFLGIGLKARHPSGTAQLLLRFDGRMDDVKSRGLYRVKEPDGRYYAYTFFEPVDARRAFPCFDEPGFKVPWRLTIEASAGSVAAANTPVARTLEMPGGGRGFVFEETPPLPSYLVAFVVGPFEIVDAGSAGHHATPLRFILPQQRAAELRYAREITPRVVERLEDWFGSALPVKKLDVAVVPRFWGTMEHPGIVAMGQPLTLIKEGEETLYRKQFYTNILTHELSHYWFGDLVTMAWWNETWLNEGMAEWADRQVTALVEPSWKYDRMAWVRAEWAMNADSLSSAAGLRKPVQTATDIRATFNGSTTYSKGDAVLGMFQAWIGPERFQKGIRRYLRDHAWGNVTTDHLLAALGAETSEAIGPALRGFINQPGVPDVELRLVCDRNDPHVHVSQKRYRPLGQSFDINARWQIPVCVRWPEGGTCQLVKGTTADLTLGAKHCPTWLVGNAGATGYYHVSYDRPMRESLMTNRTALTTGERVVLLRDVLMDVRAGRVDIGEGLAFAPAFLTDADAPVMAAAMSLLYLAPREKIPADLLPNYRRMTATLIGPIAARMGWIPTQDESPDNSQIRLNALGAMIWDADDRPSADMARELADKWLQDRRAVASDVHYTAVYAAAYNGDRDLFDRFLAAARGTTDRSEKALLYGALGSFRQPELAQRALGSAARSNDRHTGRRFDLVGRARHSGNPGGRLQLHQDSLRRDCPAHARRREVLAHVNADGVL